MPLIDPSAVVHPGARLAPDVEVGPFAVIEDRVSLGAGCRVGAHAVIRSLTEMGEGNVVFPYASVGEAPQHLKYAGEETRLAIGSHNTFREFVTLHRGTAGGGGETRIGDHCLLMAYAHVAHDCRIGDRVIIVNAVQMGGHVVIEENAFVGGLTAIHQFVRVGAHAMVGGASAVAQDVPPYTTATGNRAELRGLNLVGLTRRGFAKETVLALKRAYRNVFRSGLTLKDAVARTRAESGGVPEVERLLAFLESSERGFCRHPARASSADGGEE